MWVPLVEYGESNAPGADYFVEKYTAELMQRDPKIDTIILGCTHYPLLRPKIREALPESVELISQGELVASSLADYLLRHPEMEHGLSRRGRDILPHDRVPGEVRRISLHLHRNGRSVPPASTITG